MRFRVVNNQKMAQKKFIILINFIMKKQFLKIPKYNFLYIIKSKYCIGQSLDLGRGLPYTKRTKKERRSNGQAFMVFSKYQTFKKFYF